MDDECSICLEFLSLGDVAVLNCHKNHRFHFNCIGSWIYNQHKKNNMKLRCPLCMQDNVEITNIIKSNYGSQYDNLFITSTPTTPILSNTKVIRKRKNNNNDNRYHRLNNDVNDSNDEIDEICCVIL